MKYKGSGNDDDPVPEKKAGGKLSKEDQVAAMVEAEIAKLPPDQQNDPAKVEAAVAKAAASADASAAQAPAADSSADAAAPAEEAPAAPKPAPKKKIVIKPKAAVAAKKKPVVAAKKKPAATPKKVAPKKKTGPKLKTKKVDTSPESKDDTDDSKPDEKAAADSGAAAADTPPDADSATQTEEDVNAQADEIVKGIKSGAIDMNQLSGALGQTEDAGAAPDSTMLQIKSQVKQSSYL